MPIQARLADKGGGIAVGVGEGKRGSVEEATHGEDHVYARRMTNIQTLLVKH